MATTKNLIKEILLAARPVGSYYASSEPTDPAKLFGGTWRRITNRVIYAASDQHPAGSTGGAEKVTLTKDEIPATGILADFYGTWREIQSKDGVVQTNTTGNWSQGLGRWNTGGAGVKVDGGGQAHDNMMPYIAAYMWQRTA